MPYVLARLMLLFTLGACCSGCKSVAPSNAREWSPELSVSPYAELHGDLVKIHNVRNCKWLTSTDYVLDHYDRTYDLNTLESVDFIVAPFMKQPNLAHTMLSFGFGGNEFLGLSVEVRREKGEDYNALAGFGRKYELMYVLGDERDLIQLSSNQLHYPVYLYRVNTTPPKIRALFNDVLARTNKLRREPEFYNTLTNNCTTNIVRHVNSIAPGKVPPSYKTVFTGYSDEFAYELGLLEKHGSFAETRELALVTELAIQYAEAPDFSRKIRDSQLRQEAVALRKSLPNPAILR